MPRPAMFVATVTDPTRPACATMAASRSCCFAFSTWCGTPRRLSIALRCSEFSMDVVPTSVGCPLLCRSSISCTAAFHLPVPVL